VGVEPVDRADLTERGRRTRPEGEIADLPVALVERQQVAGLGVLEQERFAFDPAVRRATGLDDERAVVGDRHPDRPAPECRRQSVVTRP
jgi:hypothetical protein